MTSYVEKEINIPGFTLALKIWNPEAERPVLCFHGKLDNAASYDLLAPLLPDIQLVAVDCPGTGLSSWYPESVIPHWKNDAFLMLHLLNNLGWETFDILAHSWGSLPATFLSIARPNQVGKLVLLDILGPTVNFIEQATTTYLDTDVDSYLNANKHPRQVFENLDMAIEDRMKIGNISHQAAKALVERGMKACNGGWVWTFDPRLHCVSSTLPYEDEIRAIFRAIKADVCLIRANEGVPYPDSVFQGRAESIQHLTVQNVQGGHHVHMDDPTPVAAMVSEFLG